MAAESIVLGLLALLLVFVVFRFSHWAVCCVYQGFAKKHFQSIERVREERTFGDKGRNALLVGAIAILSLSFANPAFATEFGYVFYGPVTFTYEGATTYEVGIVAENQYDAAAYMLGYDPNSEEFTLEVKALLSNSDTGTAFYGFAQNFVHPNEAGSVFSPEFWSTANAVYGHEYVWRGTYTQTGKLAAQIALEAILNGGDSGGGSGGGSGGESGGIEYNGWVLIDLTPTGYTTTSHDYAQYSGVALTKNYYDNLVRTLDSSSDGLHLWITYGGQARTLNDFVTVTATNIQPEFVENYAYYWPTGNISVNTTNNGFWQGRVAETIVYDGKKYLKVPHSPAGGLTYPVGTFRNVPDQNRPVYSYYYGGAVGPVEPDIPDTNWPVPVDPHIWDEPPVPDPPEPSTPIITDDPIYLPDPTMPIPTPEDGPTYVTADLSAVLDAMNRHCIHLQNAIYGAASQFWGLLSSKMTNDLSAFTAWLGDWLEVIADNITDGILHLENYLHSLAVWLAEQFDYSITASEYNDGSVVAWLKKIWAKLGTGPIVTRPDDPVADPIGIGDWLGSFFAGLLNDLKGLIDSILGEFGTDLETLITKFPISIPWDVAIVLGALVAPPQVPHIEYPMYTVGMGGLEYVTDVVIDLSDWSDIMGVVRNFELLTFGGFLAMKTKHFMELMEGVDV